MSGSPEREQGQAPGLVESPESVLGRKDDDRLLEMVDERESSYRYHLNDEEGAANKMQDLIQFITNLIEDVQEQISITLNFVSKDEQERRRYQIGGIVLIYLSFMYLCSWTVAPVYHVCPAYNETLAVSVAWRLSRGAHRPKDTCALDEEVEQMLEQRERSGDGVFVRMTRPVTFLPGGRHRYRHSQNVKDKLYNATTNQTIPTLYNENKKSGKEEARWVSLRHGRRTYNPVLAIWRFILRHLVYPKRSSDEALLKEIENHPFPHAFTQEPLLSNDDMDFLEAWSDRLTDEIPDWHRRVAKVAWGGRSKWWHPVFPRSSYYPLETIDGGDLLYPYYQAMQPYMRDENFARFPRRQCSSGCDTQVAILSTLEWRESYWPWMATPEVLEENQDGWVYARGLSKPSPLGHHGIVWLRLGRHTVRDAKAYTRAIIQSIEKALSDALRQGRVGRVNLVLDAAGYEWGKIPDIHEIKQLFSVLQDNYPGRFGAAFLCNMSPAAEILFSILKPLLSKEVLGKVYILPLDPLERNQQLETVIPSEYMPTWIGGSDKFDFNARSYYPLRFIQDVRKSNK